MSQSVNGDTFEEPSTSQRVIAAVAETTGESPTEVGPLYHVVDPDALDRLFSATRRGGRNGGRVEFTFAGCEVVVRGNGDVEVTELDEVADVSGGPVGVADVSGDREETIEFADGESPRARTDPDGA